MDMFLLFLSYYEASDHRMAGDAIDEIIADLYRQFKYETEQSLRERLEKMYTKAKVTSVEGIACFRCMK